MRRPAPRRGERAPPPALATAVRMLARREYPRVELRARLVARGIAATEADAALDELARRGLLSDARYADALVAQKAGRWGRRAIAHELKEKGVDAHAAKAALAPLGERDEVEEAHAVWRRRYESPPADQREKARQVRFLVARGYPLSVAFAVLKRAGAAPVEDDE